MVFKKDSSKAVDDAVYAQINSPLLIRKELLLIVLGSAKMLQHYNGHLKLQEKKTNLRKELEVVGEELKVLFDELKLKDLPHVRSEKKIARLEEHKQILIEEPELLSVEEDIIEKEIRDIEEKIRNL